MPSFFIDRPIFAWVIALLISIGGILSMLHLGVESYPNIAPPSVTVEATYPGADAHTTEKAVTQVIEQQLTGIDHLLYFNSSSSAAGHTSIRLTFKDGTNPDTAQLQVQNKVALATSQLPASVIKQGITVAKQNTGFLMVVALKSSNPTVNSTDLNDLVASQVLKQIARVPGVGGTQHFGSQYAMRIWLNPDKLHAYGLSSSQVLSAIRTQNVQFAAGATGADPALPGQGITATVSTEGHFTNANQFKHIILRKSHDGSIVTLGDVARVALGSSFYGAESFLDGHPIAGFAILLQPGANALDVSTAVRAKMNELAPSFPPGVTWTSPFDSTKFVRYSINEVIQTLMEAIFMVFLVILLFLQNLRATLIPLLVIPVTLLGSFLGMSILGFTINQLTLFAMVLAIGIVVDDAIVVIENVERIMHEEDLPPKEATRKGMGQITGAVVAITVVLTAVFIPSALEPGASGVIYRQFALTLAMTIGFSAFLALSFTPALCANFLKPEGHRKQHPFFGRFNQLFSWTTQRYTHHIGKAVNHTPRWMLIFVLITVLGGVLYQHLPGSFLPEEDQGFALSLIQLPPGATKQRTEAVMAKMRSILEKDPEVKTIMQIVGFSFLGQAENTAMAFIKLKDWKHRKHSVMAFIQEANKQLAHIEGARIFVMNLPAANGLGAFGGFDIYLQDRAGHGRHALTRAGNMLLGKAHQEPLLAHVRPNTMEDAPQWKLSVDRNKANSLGLSVSDIYNSINLMLAPTYVNDFSYHGRIKKVMIQADVPYRMGPEALDHFYAPSHTAHHNDGTPLMIPLGNVVHARWIVASPSLTRYNGYPAVEITGSAAPGHSSGQAMHALEKIIHKALPHGYGYDWSGYSYQELVSGNTATLLMLLSAVVVFLALAALYESWSIPLSVLMAVPIGLLGAIVFTMLRGLSNGIFFKVGLITVIGLATKNAILMIEFSVSAQHAGRSLRKAIMEATRLRLRPIVMTSQSFILGVLPLYISTGAGAHSRQAIGTGVIGGMLFATFLGLLLIPLFYVVVRRLLGDPLDGNAQGTKEELPMFDSDPIH